MAAVPAVETRTADAPPGRLVADPLAATKRLPFRRVRTQITEMLVVVLKVLVVLVVVLVVLVVVVVVVVVENKRYVVNWSIAWFRPRVA